MHRGRRDHLTRLVLDEEGTPVASEPTYEIPGPLGSAERVTAAALEIERSCAETYAWLVANTVGAAPPLGRAGPDKHCGPRAHLPRKSRDLPRSW